MEMLPLLGSGPIEDNGELIVLAPPLAQAEMYGINESMKDLLTSIGPSTFLWRDWLTERDEGSLIHRVMVLFSPVSCWD